MAYIGHFVFVYLCTWLTGQTAETSFCMKFLFGVVKSGFSNWKSNNLPSNHQASGSLQCDAAAAKATGELFL